MPRPTLKTIVDVVCQSMSLNKKRIRQSEKLPRKYTNGRAMISMISREYQYNVKEIARELNVHHSTVCANTIRGYKLLNDYDWFEETYHTVKNKINEVPLQPKLPAAVALEHKISPWVYICLP